MVFSGRTHPLPLPPLPLHRRSNRSIQTFIALSREAPRKVA